MYSEKGYTPHNTVYMHAPYLTREDSAFERCSHVRLCLNTSCNHTHGMYGHTDIGYAHVTDSLHTIGTWSPHVCLNVTGLARTASLLPGISVLQISQKIPPDIVHGSAVVDS